jgi:hypothetical protein
MDWSQQQIKDFIKALSKLPDFDKLPLPKQWYEESDVPYNPPKNLGLMEYLNEHKNTRLLAPVTSTEERGPVDGGVREVKLEEPLQLQITSTPLS